jgi:hypothetical protein
MKIRGNVSTRNLIDVPRMAVADGEGGVGLIDECEV